jgi:hypothetical protein
MGFLEKIFTGGAGELVEKVGSTVDKFVTTSAEKEQLKQELIKTLYEHESKQQAELTKRLEIDMASDSWLSKNIRPLSLVFTTILVTWLSITDGNLGEFEVKQSYITLIEGLMTLQYMFYFGSRGVEKVMDTVGKYNIGRKKK